VTREPATPEIYGPKRAFGSRAAAERFLQHLTRELTAGGIPHWVEVRQQPPRRWIAVVHAPDCAGGERCRCPSPSS
jgi:hypothetical protein